MTMKAREAFQYAFEATGGERRLAEWAEANYDEFVKQFSKLIPIDIQSNGHELAALTWRFGGREVNF